MAKPLQIILVGFYDSVGLQMLDGIGGYLRGRPEWDFRLAPGSLERGYAHWVRRMALAWKPDGMIASIRSRSLYNVIARSGVPAVNVSDTFAGGLPQVIHDNVAIGRMAAGHFLDRGLRHFGCILLAQAWFSRQRCQGFRQAVEGAGHSVDVFSGLHKKGNLNDYLGLGEGLKAWLRQLPKPVGILANYDYQGQELIWACQHMGLRVPDDVAVVGVGNDERMCLMRSPALSSIDTQAWRIGFEAAKRLHRILRRGRSPKAPVLIAPLRAVPRQSSDILAMADKEVAAAVRFIRDNACKRSIGVSEILAEVTVSRRSLERRFAEVVGRSPHEEIDRVRLSRARELLAGTDRKIPQVAEQTGFARHENLCVFFKRKTGLTPSRFRAESRPRPPAKPA